MQTVKRWITLALFAVASLSATSRVLAATLTIDIVPTSSTTVAPGGSVSYELIGELSGDVGFGLALWGGDLQSSYSIPGGLPQLDPGPEMGSFVKPDGLTNPAGYGGTPIGDDLLSQIGGGQNTIGNTTPPFPIGEVVTGIGISPVVLASGVANLPTIPGLYQLEISNFFSNVITGGSGPPPAVYSVEAAIVQAGIGTMNITVLPEPSSVFLTLLGGISLVRCRRSIKS
ncbi:MAG: hypothetical protein DHS20C16_24030 [Phycisphaerae bacterium]|nr:MAG: hypothetical protein DHS20C16_24030 [Phycisphaerae bacterium]